MKTDDQSSRTDQCRDRVTISNFESPVPLYARLMVRFDWGIDFHGADSGDRGGVELRDLYGRPVFAVTHTVRGALGWSATALAADADGVGRCGTDKGEPRWTWLAETPDDRYAIALTVDFDAGTLRYEIGSGSHAVLARGTAATTATSLAVLYAIVTGADVTQRVEHLTVRHAGTAPDAPLAGATMYAFGDSLLDGHLYPKAGFATYAARQEGMTLVDRARNGATILPSRLSEGRRVQICEEVKEIPADAPAPDFVVFNGGTNDAYVRTCADRIGTVGGARNPSALDLETFAGNFEHTIHLFSQRWPDAAIVYVTAGRMNGRDYDFQTKLRPVELAACKAWHVAIADVFADASLDARDPRQRLAYSFYSLGPTGLPASESDSVAQGKTPSGIHPNLASVERFYVPTLVRTLRRVGALRSSRRARCS